MNQIDKNTQAINRCTDFWDRTFKNIMEGLERITYEINFEKKCLKTN